MKTKHLLTASVALVAMLSSCNSDNISIKVKDSDDYYRFTAVYDKKRTPRVNEFINQAIAPTHIESDEDIDVTTILDDNTRFKWESSPGELMIYLDKDENNRASYQRIKNMCEKVKNIIGGQK